MRLSKGCSTDGALAPIEQMLTSTTIGALSLPPVRTSAWRIRVIKITTSSWDSRADSRKWISETLDAAAHASALPPENVTNRLRKHLMLPLVGVGGRTERHSCGTVPQLLLPEAFQTAFQTELQTAFLIWACLSFVTG